MQGVPQSCLPPPPARIAGVGAHPQIDRPGQGLHPSFPAFTSGAHLRRQSGSRTLPDDEGDSNHDVSENQPEWRRGFRSEGRSERSGPSAGEQNLPPRVHNTRTRSQADNSW